LESEFEFDLESEFEPELFPPEDFTAPLAYTGCSVTTVSAATATMARTTVNARIVRIRVCIISPLLCWKNETTVKEHCL
jgi:hypothetical protein